LIMRNIIITPKRIKKELLILLVCLLIAIAVNIAAIISYQTSWWEILTQMGYEIAIALVLYFIFLIVRVLKFFILKIFSKK
jgi:membrane protease YdiL (CAAX protease family)